MQDLYKGLGLLATLLRREMTTLQDFGELLRAETSALAEVNLKELQQVVSLKDQLVVRFKRIEKERQQLFSHLLYQMGADPRVRIHSLPRFLETLEQYYCNVEKLLNEEQVQLLRQLKTELNVVHESYLNSYKASERQFLANKKRLVLLKKNIEGSVSFLDQFKVDGSGYSKSGLHESSLGKSSGLQIKA